MPKVTDAIGLSLATQTMVLSVCRLMRAKGLISDGEFDDVIHDSLTVLETAVPDQDEVRAARIILEQLLACKLAA